MLRFEKKICYLIGCTHSQKGNQREMKPTQLAKVLVFAGILFLDGSQSYLKNLGSGSSFQPSGQRATHTPTADGRKRLKALSRPQIEDDDFNEVSISKMKNMIKRIFRKKAEPGTLMLVSRDLGVYSHRLSSSCMNVLHYSLLK